MTPIIHHPSGDIGTHPVHRCERETSVVGVFRYSVFRGRGDDAQRYRYHPRTRWKLQVSDGCDMT